jgi:biopolymer transport protein ExbB/TolQ
MTGETGLANNVAFLLFATGIGIVIAIMVRIAHRCLFSKDQASQRADVIE